MTVTHDHPEDHDADLALGLGLLEAQLREAALPQPRQRWLARRGLGIGCSDLPAVWLALGLATTDEKARARRYIEEQAMRVIAAKARQAKMPKVSTDARLGRIRETPLFKTWRDRLAAGDYVSEVERLVDHRTVVHIEGHPTLQRLLPLVDRHERRLIDSTDAIALLVDKRFAVVQGKCTVEPTDVPPWYWELQVQGEIAVTDADIGIIVCGEGWAREGDGFEHGPLRVWPVLRNQELIDKIRWACRTSWTHIERFRAAAAEHVAKSDADWEMSFEP